MALHILNCSIDAPDAQSDSIAEDLSYNDIETIAELIIENFLGIENAIAEYDEHDSEDEFKIEMAKILLYNQTPVLVLPGTIPYFKINTACPSYKNICFTQYHPDIVSPPPQLV